MREQFFGVDTDDAATHLNKFVELCDMQKYRDVDGDIIKLQLFPFSLRGKAKEWLLSLPKNSIDSRTKCKDAFISRYYPPSKIISRRSDIMKFKQFDNEHVAQAWGRMKSMVKNCPTHGLTTWMIIQTFYAGLNFSSRNLLDSATGGTFMSITLGSASKLLDDMMANYSEWHTERAPQGKKVNSVEETSSLSDKIDMIMASGKSHVDPNNVPLASLVAQEEPVDVNFIKNNNFNNNDRNNFGNNNCRPYPYNSSNSYGNSYSNNRSAPSDLEVMLKDFIIKKTAFNKTIEEKFAKIDTLVSKVDSLAHDVDLLKLKVCLKRLSKVILLLLLMPFKLELMKMLGCWLNCMLGGKEKMKLLERIALLKFVLLPHLVKLKLLIILRLLLLMMKPMVLKKPPLLLKICLNLLKLFLIKVLKKF
jgi:hypothetical protein